MSPETYTQSSQSLAAAMLPKPQLLLSYGTRDAADPSQDYGELLDAAERRATLYQCLSAPLHPITFLPALTEASPYLMESLEAFIRHAISRNLRGDSDTIHIEMAFPPMAPEERSKVWRELKTDGYTFPNGIDKIVLKASRLPDIVITKPEATADPLPHLIHDLLAMPNMCPEARALIEAAAEAQRTGKLPTMEEIESLTKPTMNITPFGSLRWPEIFDTKNFDGRSDAALAADGLEGWAICASGWALCPDGPHPNFAEVMAEIGARLGIPPLPEVLSAWIDEWTKQNHALNCQVTASLLHPADAASAPDDSGPLCPDPASPAAP